MSLSTHGHIVQVYFWNDVIKNEIWLIESFNVDDIY